MREKVELANFVMPLR